MTVSFIDDVTDVTPRVQYTAVVQTVFDVPFVFPTDDSLFVDVDGTTLVLTTDYIVAGAGDDLGGNITLTTPTTDGQIVTIVRDIPIERQSDFQQNGPWNSDTINNDLNILTMIDQQLEAAIGRCLHTSLTSVVTAADMEVDPATFAGKVLSFDSVGRPVAVDPTSVTSALGDYTVNGSWTFSPTASVIPGVKVNGADNQYAAWFKNANGTDRSFGVLIQAGTPGSQADLALLIQNKDAAATNPLLFQVSGDGSITGLGSSSGTEEDMTPDHGNWTVTLTGCTTSPTGTAHFCRHGKIVILVLPGISGTSNSTAMTLTGSMPASIQTARVQWARVAIGLDGGSIVPDISVKLDANSTLTFAKNGSSAGFTATGTKGISSPSVVAYMLN